MIERFSRPCKRCHLPFEQPRLRGRPMEYCSWACKDMVRRLKESQVTRERYAALRSAGVPPKQAQPASTTRHRFEATMAAFKGESNGSAAAE